MMFSLGRKIVMVNKIFFFELHLAVKADRFFESFFEKLIIVKYIQVVVCIDSNITNFVQSNEKPIGL